MAYPAEGIEIMIRNKITDVAKFFELKHQDRVKVINCSNRKYNYDHFNKNVYDM